MPRYDYQCTSCELQFELTQSFSEAGKGTCPDCSGAGRRVFHAVPVIYKGSGFYTTDYGRPKAPIEDKSKDTKSSTESKSSTTSSESTSSGSTESKTESTSTAASEATT